MQTLTDYTKNDVVPEDRAAYMAHVDLWQTELHPNGALECYFAAEIVRAAWRIQYCSPLGPQASSDPTSSDQARATWLRYRDHTNLGIRRNLEELRRLQSDRCLQTQLGLHLPGVASLKIVLPALKRQKMQASPESQPENQPENVATQPSPTAAARRYLNRLPRRPVTQPDATNFAPATRAANTSDAVVTGLKQAAL